MQTYTYEKTNDPDLFRMVDRNGNWTHYYHKPSNTYLRAVNHILDTGYTKGKRYEMYLKNITAAEADQKLKDAGERGDKVHKFIEYLFSNRGKANRATEVYNSDTGNNEALTNDEWDCIIAFQNFWAAHKPTLLYYELPVYNLAHRYAGTTDAILILNKKCDNPRCTCGKFIGQVGLFDWKSSSGIRDENGAQVAAYSNTNAPKTSYTAILRIGTSHKSGYELAIYNKAETDIHLQEFFAAITISNRDYKPFDPEKEIKSVPEKVEIDLTQKIEKTKKVAKKKTKTKKKK